MAKTMSLYNNFNINKAFTLAEVLITLGIIGVVAAMTIPSLIQNTNKQEIITNVKAASSILWQATILINNDCGDDLMNCIDSPTASTDNDPTSRAEVTALYKAKLRIAKDCTDTSAGCFADVTYKYLSNDPFTNLHTISWMKDAQFLLSNGMSVGFDWNVSTFILHVDINGPKPPNQMGKDLFSFIWDSTKHTLNPINWGDCGTSAQGYSCVYRIIQDGWQIKYY